MSTNKVLCDWVCSKGDNRGKRCNKVVHKVGSTRCCHHSENCLLNKDKWRIKNRTGNKEYNDKRKQYYKEITRKNFEKMIRVKINTYFTKDKKKFKFDRDDNYITIEWVKQELESQGNKCLYCANDLELCEFKAHERLQFTVDRIDNSKPHLISNCVICCAYCNIKRRNMDFLLFMELSEKKLI